MYSFSVYRHQLKSNISAFFCDIHSYRCWSILISHQLRWAEKCSTLQHLKMLSCSNQRNRHLFSFVRESFACGSTFPLNTWKHFPSLLTPIPLDYPVLLCKLPCVVLGSFSFSFIHLDVFKKVFNITVVYFFSMPDDMHVFHCFVVQKFPPWQHVGLLMWIALHDWEAPLSISLPM